MASGTLGIIGYGNMGSAIVKGLVSSGTYMPSDIHVVDTDEEKLNSAEAIGHFTHTSPNFLVDVADIIIIAVKPGKVEETIVNLAGLKSETLVISIAAGIGLSMLEGLMPNSPVIRVMPNTPCLVGAGVNVMARGKKAGDEDVEKARKVLSAVGFVSEVGEDLMDAVTGLSGSGPAYVALMIDAMSDGGVKMGLPRPMALKLAAQTVYGTARMILEKGIHPDKLRDMVTSPAGTTIAGVATLEENAFRSAVIKAVEAATKRSKELS